MLTIVTALPWEAARFLARLRGARRVEMGEGWAVRGERGPVSVRVVVSGPGEERAARAAAQLGGLEPPATGVLATGVAAGLAPEVRVGEVVLARRVLQRRRGEGRGEPPLAAEREFRRFVEGALERAGVRWRDGDLVTVAEPLLSPAAKREEGRRTGALAAAMEDAVWGRAAADLGVPFVAARAVLDPLGGGVPAEVLGWDWRGASGGVVARAVLRRPGLALALARLAWQRRAAVRAIDRMLEALVQLPSAGEERG